MSPSGRGLDSPTLRSIVGGANVATEREQIDGVPVAECVRPGTAGEVAACLALAREARQPVVVAGGRTKLHWGHPPDARSVVLLDLSRLDAPFELDSEEGVGSFGAGVRVEALERAARQAGQRSRLPRVPGSATLGGVIASDPPEASLSPARRFRNDLLGLEVALTNGELTRCGGRVVKNVTGFDLMRLYAGSYGTLGVITQATLRLRPLPVEERVRSRDFASFGEALVDARALLGAGVEPDGVAVLPGGGGARLLWRLEGQPRELDSRDAHHPGAEGKGWPDVEAKVADLEPSPPGAARIRTGGRPSDTAEIAALLVREFGHQAIAVALPQAGIVIAWLPEDAVEGWIESAARADLAVQIERAAPELRARLDVFGRPGPTLPLMRALKARFDPERILAPGRFAGGL